MTRTPDQSTKGPAMGQHVVAGVVRLILFAIVGIGGWMIGGTIGAFAGVGLDLLLIGERAPMFGVVSRRSSGSAAGWERSAVPPAR